MVKTKYHVVCVKKLRNFFCFKQANKATKYTLGTYHLPDKPVGMTTGSPSSKYVVYATASVYRELYGKITDGKKNCVNNYLLWNKVFLPQMCGELVSCAEFRAILTPFSEVIRKPLLRFPDNFTKRRQNGSKLGTRDKFATHLR